MIVYGKGVKAIGEDLHVTTEKAQEIKDSVLKAFPDLKEYLDNVVVFCKEHNYVEDFFGSRRRLPDINLPEYEFEFEDKTLDKRTIGYYTNLYTGKLNKAFGQNDKQEIIRIAKSYGIIIKQNGGFIAQAVRNAYNSPVQCVSGDTFITTKEHGLSKISECVDEDVTVWDGDNFVNASCMYTGKKRLCIVEFWDGKTLKCSENHKLQTVTTTGHKSMTDIATFLSQPAKGRNTMISVSEGEPTRIKNIILTDEYIDMYDIVNSDSHKFVANGIITHNCTAAHLTKISMYRVARNKRLMEMGAYLELSIHD